MLGYMATTDTTNEIKVSFYETDITFREKDLDRDEEYFTGTDDSYVPISQSEETRSGLFFISSQNAVSLLVDECDVSGLFGSIYGNFITVYSSQTTVEITGGIYDSNYGVIGGVFYFSNLVSLTVTDSIFTNNVAFQGGVFYAVIEGTDNQVFDYAIDFGGETDGTSIITLNSVTVTGNTLSHVTEMEY